MGLMGLVGELGNPAYCEGNIGSSDNHGIHEASDCFTIRYGRGKRRIIWTQISLEWQVSIGRGTYRVGILKLKTLNNVSNVPCLVDQYRMVDKVAVNLKTDIIVHWTMSDFEIGLEMLNNCVEIGFMSSTDNAVVHKDTNNKINGLIRCKSIVDTRVSVAGKKVV